MAETRYNAPAEPETIPKSLHEYRSKVEEIIRSENERLRRLAEEEAKDIIDGAWQKAENIISDSQKKAAGILGNSEQKAAEIITECHRKSDEIIENARQEAGLVRDDIIEQARREASVIAETARQEAEQIKYQAGEAARKEAKSRVKQEEDKIIERARQEADSLVVRAREEAGNIIARANRDAEKQTLEIIENSKREAELLIKDEIEKCRLQAQSQANQVKARAEKNAARMISNIVNGGKEVNDSILLTVQNAENLVARFRDEIQTELGELTRRMMESKTRLSRTTSEYTEQADSVNGASQVTGNSAVSDSLWVILKGEKFPTGENGNYLFKGQIELKTLSSFDWMQIKTMKKFLIQVPGVKYLGEFSTEEGTTISFELKEPLPLLDILGNLPSIEKVLEEGDNLRLTLHCPS